MTEFSIGWTMLAVGLGSAVLSVVTVFVVAEWSAICALFADLFTDAPIDDDAAFTPPKLDADEIIIAASNRPVLRRIK